MLPPLVADAVRSLPADLGAVCRPRAWEELAAAPGDGLRSVRDILVHLMGTEAGWAGHVVRGEPRRRSDPAAFCGLDSIQAAWGPLRAASLAAVLGLTEPDRRSRRALPWDGAGTVGVEEVVWHAAGHGQDHRGQVFTRLGLLGRRDLPDHDLIRVA